MNKKYLERKLLNYFSFNDKNEKIMSYNISKMTDLSIKLIPGPPGPMGVPGRDGRDGRHGIDGLCECKEVVDDLITKNQVLEEKIKKLEAMLNELYYSPDLKGPGFLAAETSYHKNEQERTNS
jgi:hypothetical protein